MSFSAKEVNKFNDLAHEWWNLDGEFRTLHHINPVRLQFISSHVSLKQQQILDVGCGGGILSESLAQNMAHVQAIDLAPTSIEIAKLHLHESNLAIDYQCISIEDMAKQKPHFFDTITCMEMLEHVPEPQLILDQCAKLLKTDGYIFLSTLNRTLKSYALGVLATEYILKLVPKGTHSYDKFIKPHELRYMLEKSGFELVDIKGLTYNPFTKTASISDDVSINYMVAAKLIKA